MNRDEIFIETRIYLNKYISGGLLIDHLIYQLADILQLETESLHYEFDFPRTAEHYLKIVTRLSPDQANKLKGMIYLGRKPVKKIYEVIEKEYS